MSADKLVHFTSLFNRAIGGDRCASSLLYEVALPRLLRIAASLLQYHRSHQTLPPTALVNECWLKIRCFRLPIFHREQFFRLSAHAMRQVLIDRGRAKSLHNSNSRELQHDLNWNTAEQELESLVARDALERFEKIDCKAARIIRMHYMEGYSWEEVSRLTGRAVWRVRNDADFALKWMRNYLS